MILYEDIIKELNTNPEYILSDDEWKDILSYINNTDNAKVNKYIDKLVKVKFKDHEWTYVSTYITDKAIEGY